MTMYGARSAISNARRASEIAGPRAIDSEGFEEKSLSLHTRHSFGYSRVEYPRDSRTPDELRMRNYTRRVQTKI